MENKKVTLVYFSASDTTRKVLRSIARGMAAEVAEVDITPPADRAKEAPAFSENDFVLFGSPCYGGLMPLFVKNYFEKIKGQNTPCAVVTVFGNRAFDDVLVEMEDLVTENGFKVLGGAAFVGEHSFSPRIAGGRPDAGDLKEAEAFGAKLREKLESGGAMEKGAIPGNRPYKERPAPVKNTIAPSTTDACIDCKVCANLCPTGAINYDDVRQVEAEKCIKCLRCVRVCPTGAKVFDHEMFQATVEKCVAAFGSPRREPSYYL